MTPATASTTAASMQRLQDKVAIITGGAGEVGMACARLFVDHGAKLVLCGRNQASLQDAKKALDSDNIAIFAGDVTREDDNRALVAFALQRFERLDVFFANAGIEGVVAPITDYPLEVFQQTLAVNVVGPFLGIKHALPAMAQNGGGSIIVCSSVAGTQGGAGICGYNTSKHAVTGLVRSAARDAAPLKVRVNSVNPGPLESKMMSSLERGGSPQAPEKARALMLRTVPMARYGNLAEVAQMVLFLASEESSYCTGALFAVDGGKSS